MGLLHPTDSTRIEAAISKAEQDTAAEIVVALVPESADWRAPRLALAWVLAVLTALIISGAWPAMPTDLVVASVVPFAVGWYLLWGVPVLWRLLIPVARADERANGKALELFAAHGLHRTRDGTGLLVLISELEHRVVVLGDRGIDAELHAEGFARLVAELTSAIKRGRVAEGVEQVVGEVGGLLAKRYPRKADDVNELPNRVIE